jgi:hypothetical protein
MVLGLPLSQPSTHRILVFSELRFGFHIEVLSYVANWGSDGLLFMAHVYVGG